MFCEKHDSTTYTFRFAKEQRLLIDFSGILGLIVGEDVKVAVVVVN
mgnify:CR=1 FL=1